MEIRFNSVVDCAYNTCGRATRVVVDPATDKVTDVVVRDRRWPHTERLVPIAFIEDSNRAGITLWCDDKQWQKLRPFYGTQTNEEEIPLSAVGYEPEYSHLTLLRQKAIRYKQILSTAIDISGQTPIKVADKSVGRLSELITDAAGYITHIVMRTGVPWARRDVVIPINEILRITENEIVITLDQSSVAALPMVPQHRYRTAVPA